HQRRARAARLAFGVRHLPGAAAAIRREPVPAASPARLLPCYPRAPVALERLRAGGGLRHGGHPALQPRAPQPGGLRPTERGPPQCQLAGGALPLAAPPAPHPPPLPV